MGRKGVSKRKPSQTKSKPFSSDMAGGSVSSALTPLVRQPIKPMDGDKTDPSTDRKKKSRKG